MSIDDYFKKKGTTANTSSTPKTSTTGIDSYFKKMDYERQEPTTQPVVSSASTPKTIPNMTMLPEKTGTDLFKQGAGGYSITEKDGKVTVNMDQLVKDTVVEKPGTSKIRSVLEKIELALRPEKDKEGVVGSTMLTLGKGLFGQGADLIGGLLKLPEKNFKEQVKLNEELNGIYGVSEVPKYAEIMSDLGDILKEKGQDIRNILQEKSSFEEDKLGTQVLEGIGGVVPTFAAAYFWKNPGMVLGVVGNASMNAEDVYDENLKKGESEEVALQKYRSTFNATLAINSVFTTLGATGKFANNASIFKKKSVEFVKDALFEIFEENAEQITSNLNTGKPWHTGLKETTLVTTPIAFLMAGLGVTMGSSINSSTELSTKMDNVISKNKDFVSTLADQGYTKNDIVEILSGVSGMDTQNMTTLVDQVIGDDTNITKTFEKNEEKNFNIAMEEAFITTQEEVMNEEQKAEFDDVSQFLQKEDPVDEAKFQRKVDKQTDLTTEAKKYDNAKDFYELMGQKNRSLLSEKGIRGEEKITKFWEDSVGKKTETTYEMSHRPSKSGSGFNIEESGSAPDFYDHPEWYTNSQDGTYQESIRSLMKIRNKPDAEVTVYRASPKNELNEGDWITLSKKYAKQESETENTPVHSFKVKAKDIQFAGDDINEFGYFPKTEMESQLTDIWNKAQETPKEKKTNLSKEQYDIVRSDEFKEWFGDWENDPENASKVVDENGEPLVVYHGSAEVFNVFDISKKGQQGQTRGYGFYFTPNKGYASSYSSRIKNGEKQTGQLVEAFLNIRKPIQSDEKTITKQQLKKVISKLAKIDVDHISNFGDYTYSGVPRVIQDAVNMVYTNESDTDIIAEIANVIGDTDLTFKIFKEVTGIDGVMDVENPDYEGSDQIDVEVVFNSNQIKLADGSNTTFDKDNDDIRFQGKENITTDDEVSYKVGFDRLKSLQKQHGVEFPVYAFEKIYTGEIRNGKRVEASGMYFDNSISFAKKIEKFTADHEFGHFLWKNMDSLPHLGKFNKGELYGELRADIGEDGKTATLIDLEEHMMTMLQERGEQIENGTYKEPKKKSLLDRAIDSVLNFFRDLFGMTKAQYRSIDRFMDELYFGKNTGDIVTFYDTGKTSNFMEARFNEFGEDVKPMFQEAEMSDETTLSQLESYLYDLEDQLKGHPGAKFKKFVSRTEGEVLETNRSKIYVGNSEIAKYNQRMRAEKREKRLLAVSRFAIEEEHKYLGDKDGYNEGNVTMMNDLIEKYDDLKEKVEVVKADIRVVKKNIKDKVRAEKQEEKDISKSYRKSLDQLKMENTYNDLIEEMYDISNTDEDISLAEDIRKTISPEEYNKVIEGVATQQTTKGRKTYQQIKQELFPKKDKLTVTEQNQIKTRLKEQEKGYKKGFVSGKKLGTDITNEKQERVISSITRENELRKLKENIIWRSYKKSALNALKDNVPRVEWASYMNRLSSLGTSEAKYLNLLERIYKRGEEYAIEQGDRIDRSRIRSNIAYLKKIYDIEPSLILSIKNDLNIRDSYKTGERAGQLKNELKSIKDYSLEELGFFMEELKNRIEFRKNNPKTYLDKITLRKDENSVKKALEFVDKNIVGTEERPLQNISNSLYESVMTVFYQENRSNKTRTQKMMPVMDIFTKMSVEDQELMKQYGQSSMEGNMRDVMLQYATEQEVDTALQNSREVLDEIHKELNDVGVEVPYRQFFFPRKLKPVDAETAQIMIEAFEHKMGKKATEEEKAQILNGLSRGFSGQLPFITLSGKKFEAHRLIETITEDISEFYEDFATSTIDYIYATSSVIEQRRYFGKSLIESLDYQASLSNSIGAKVYALYDQGLIKQKDINEVKKVLMDVFHHRNGEFTNIIQKFVSDYIYPLALGQIASTLKQTKDLSMQVLINDVFPKRLNTLGNIRITPEAVYMNDDFRKLDTGIDESKSLVARLLEKTLAPFGKMDNFFLRVFINSAYRRAMSSAKSNNAEFRKGVIDIFGEQKGQEFIDDLKNRTGKESDIPEMFSRWVYSEVARIRPITKLQKARGAIYAPTLYVLRNFMIKQIQFVRKESLDYIAKGIETNDVSKVAEGVYRLSMIIAVILLLGGAVDELVDWIIGKKDDQSFTDAAFENLMQIVGLNRYTLSMMDRGKPTEAFIGSFIIPAPATISWKIIDDAIKDTKDVLDDFENIKDIKSVRRIPGLGDIYYQRFGGGSEYNEKSKTTGNKEKAIAEYVSSGKSEKFDELTQGLTSEKKKEFATKANKEKKLNEIFTDKKEVKYMEDLKTGTNVEKLKVIEKMIKKEGVEFTKEFVNKGRSTYKSEVSGNNLRVLISDGLFAEIKRSINK